MPAMRSRGGDPGDGRPVFPGFREIAESRRRLLGDLVSQRRSLGLSQTEVAARMGTSQSAVARLEALAGDVRLSTLELHAEAVADMGRGPLEPAADLTRGDRLGGGKVRRR